MTLPSSLVEHPDLSDFDIRILLLLDQIGWREGERDGVVRASNREIGQRLRKSDASVRSSLKKFESFDPPLVSRDMLTNNRRDHIRLCYDRFGGATSNYPNLCVMPVEGDPDGVANGLATPLQPDHAPIEKLATPLQPEPVLVGFVPVASDQERDSGNADSLGVASRLATHPIRELDTPPPPDLGEDVEKLATPLQPEEPERLAETECPLLPLPNSVKEVVAWLPSITDDPGEIARLTRKVPLWVQRIKARCPRYSEVALDWVQDALILASDKNDVVAYAEGVLKGFVKDGGRPDVELAREAAQRLASEAAAAGTTNLPSALATPLLGAPRPSHADRTRAELARIKEGFRQNKLRKEAIDAQSP